MARVPYVNREDLDGAGQEIYDRIRRDRNSETVGLQFRALLHNPQAAGFLTSMGAQLRFKSALPENLKEFAIIVVAREWNSDIEWTAHAALAAKAGVGAASIEAIRMGTSTDVLTENESVILRFVHQLLRDKNLTDEAFAAARALLGTRGVVDLTLTCSYYTAINMAQVALRPEMEPGRASTL
jgi:4-carboxymuconolactone decarboxylase